MNTNHTPGPWYAYSPLASGVHAGHHYMVANSKPCGIIQDEDGTWVPDFPDWGPDSRIVCKTTDDEMSCGNARLIAAAPDLLEACKARVRFSTSAPVKDRWQVIIGDRVDSGHESRQLARHRVDAIRAAAIAKAEGGAS